MKRVIGKRTVSYLLSKLVEYDLKINYKLTEEEEDYLLAILSDFKPVHLHGCIYFLASFMEKVIDRKASKLYINLLDIIMKIFEELSVKKVRNCLECLLQKKKIYKIENSNNVVLITTFFNSLVSMEEDNLNILHKEEEENLIHKQLITLFFKDAEKVIEQLAYGCLKYTGQLPLLYNLIESNTFIVRATLDPTSTIPYFLKCILNVIMMPLDDGDENIASNFHQLCKFLNKVQGDETICLSCGTHYTGSIPQKDLVLYLFIPLLRLSMNQVLLSTCILSLKDMLLDFSSSLTAPILSPTSSARTSIPSHSCICWMYKYPYILLSLLFSLINLSISNDYLPVKIISNISETIHLLVECIMMIREEEIGSSCNILIRQLLPCIPLYNIKFVCFLLPIVKRFCNSHKDIDYKKFFRKCPLICLTTIQLSIMDTDKQISVYKDQEEERNIAIQLWLTSILSSFYCISFLESKLKDVKPSDLFNNKSVCTFHGCICKTISSKESIHLDALFLPKFDRNVCTLSFSKLLLNQITLMFPQFTFEDFSILVFRLLPLLMQVNILQLPSLEFLFHNSTSLCEICLPKSMKNHEILACVYIIEILLLEYSKIKSIDLPYVMKSLANIISKAVSKFKNDAVLFLLALKVVCDLSHYLEVESFYLLALNLACSKIDICTNCLNIVKKIKIVVKNEKADSILFMLLKNQ